MKMYPKRMSRIAWFTGTKRYEMFGATSRSIPTHRTVRSNDNTQRLSAFACDIGKRIRFLKKTIWLCCNFSILTPLLTQRSLVRALTYTTQVRSGGSQVFVGYGNHRAEPFAVLRRVPTLTDEQRQQRVGIRSPSPSELWPQSAKERPRES